MARITIHNEADLDAAIRRAGRGRDLFAHQTDEEPEPEPDTSRPAPLAGSQYDGTPPARPSMDSWLRGEADRLKRGR